MVGEGKELPEGWVIGRDGKTRTDTHQILEDLVKGEVALTPLGGIGEKEYLAWLERKDKGVPVNTSLQKHMVEMRDELGLTKYKFTFEQ